MFIELTSNGVKKIININYIQEIENMKNDTRITMRGYGLSVDESYEEVKALIEREVQAERGY